MDRETVITWLEICGENDDCSSCCPYGDHGETSDCRAKLVADTLAMLKEQGWQTERLTPTEPNVSINAYGRKFYYCPHCKRPILKSGIIGRPRHCEDCGQAIKWD